MAKDISTTIVLKVSGKEAENSFQGLNKLVKGLEAELRKLTPGTEEFMKKAAEVKEARRHFEQVKNEINSVNQKIDESGNKVGFIRRNLLQVGDTFRQVFTANIAGSFFEMFVSKGSQATDELLKISDAMSDVQKTAGMTLGEVKELWDAFDEMNTRTSKLDRLKIAEEAGRLGVPKEQMKEFVQEIDKVNVALGDSFKGGLEEIVGSLGKIKGLFEETKGKTYALAINEVGSAMNELAASGTASEGNIADFTLRVGALPDALKPSIDKVLGLGAAFEESGLDSQIAASGYTNFMKVAGENLEAFAYSMNMSIEEARELFNTRPEEFFLRFSEGMRGLSADETAKVFDSLKLNSLEVQKAVGAAANRTDEFRATQYDEPMPTMEKKNEVFAFNFEKHRFTNASKTMIKSGNLEFVPFPEPKGGKLIHLFFENQNLVLEWFSCPADYQRKFDFNHITDELTGEKFGALETENLVLNTGWILREEIELINALLKSRICFIIIGNQIIKARPMSKKNEMYDTAENLYAMDLEFNIKQNER